MKNMLGIILKIKDIILMKMIIRGELLIIIFSIYKIKSVKNVYIY